MNGELLNLINLTIGLKQVLRGKDFAPNLDGFPEKFVAEAHFEFAKARLFGGKNFDSLAKWIDELRRRNLKDVKLICQTEIKDLGFVGFSNAVHHVLLTSFPKDNSGWISVWSFDAARQKWSIKYSEQYHEHTRMLNVHCKDNSADFAEILQKINDFALKIGENYWAENHFQKALECLVEPRVSDDVLPQKNQQMLEAAKKSWVFGAMGSWTDSPPYASEQKGLRADYDNLSRRLYDEILHSVLFAVNEW